MNEAKITTLEAMAAEQIREDISRTPLQRLHIAFQISDFALEVHPQQDAVAEEGSTVDWIVVRKRSPQS